MKLSQNFLVDDNSIKKVISSVNFYMRPIIEIGCGKGSLTRYLNPDLCVEIDTHFIPIISKYNLIIGDGRFFPFNRGQIVSSLPYSITSNFLEEMIKNNGIKRSVLVLQKDVVDKLTTYPTYISFIINFYFKIIKNDIFPPWYFRPIPKVYSQLVILERTSNYDDKINNILKCISRYRNKTLKSLSKRCNFISISNKRAREFEPWKVRELLSLIELKYV
ncbi:16S rRNA methyltransferase [Candidatus Acidianus copahuensis]|uniref:16S rRNA methyltransferase n=1 Tax=Candidatus Acidianus copahuensis TaxID=1160895 RepID=A0A031LKN1_9CREN|nr:16S ribosomal RNA methyltransferase A [Candidatus Acidianus copahuensis]EZQ03888.1 16S rRNA methyltransferase [Candidatus Acidianus copahuensis]